MPGGGTVPTKYIDKNGKEVSADSWDLSNIDAAVITKIGFHDYKGSIRVPVMPKNVKQVPKELPSVVTSLEKTFKGLKSDKVLGIESWDTSNITNLSETFIDAENFNQDLSNWKTLNVTDMSATFFNAKKFNSPLDKWDTSNVENMQSMFYGASEFNQNISEWNVKKVKEHSNFCTNSGLKCGMTEPECKAQNCPTFCCENNKQCEMCKKAMAMK
ncbi:BspA family leucine-rich repeat surface protein [Mycoplasmopsis agalactiae]|uniref:BspA family leucine-rich repeat surface protein n=1 Tax=Mycoplasmopsis agalactiae TaxID=2110 RepID=UPI00280456F0|nr:BspA family leucine-rich repeat surface protein [Mycoplasmopsis agalactiae]